MTPEDTEELGHIYYGMWISWGDHRSAMEWFQDKDYKALDIIKIRRVANRLIKEDGGK